MKKIILALAISFVTFVPLTSIAENICLVPQDCEIISSEFSTGGGKKSIYIMEVDCKSNDGLITKYLDAEFSAGGFFSLGRITMPRKVVFKRHNKDELECDY